MEALGVALDLAHASPRAVDDALAHATKPLVVSHTGVQATCPGPRNLSDDQLRRIAATGGVIGIGYFEGAVCGDDVAAIVAALQHAVAVAGPRAVGLRLRLGRRHRRRPSTPRACRSSARRCSRRASSGDELRGIAGGNALRVLRETLPD